MEFTAKWIKAAENLGDISPVFRKEWACADVKKATLVLTALGVYDARLNGKRVSEYVLAPGWTYYDARLQYQTYDITELLGGNNELTVTVGKGWFSSPMPGWMDTEDKQRRMAQPNGIWGCIILEGESGKKIYLPTDSSWEYAESPVRFSEIYDGETYDARVIPAKWRAAEEFSWSEEILIPQEGVEIREMERVAVQQIITTPAGETVLDFGQEVTGYVEFTVDARAGEEIRILHGEVLDQQGNFYNDNYRSAKAELNYICRDGVQTWHPLLTFFGFRYLKLDKFPGEVRPEQFTAIVVYSRMRKTGKLSCGLPEVNQLFSNIFWGQKGNFLDVPTDCPQRDERLGWTGDAQVFVKTASYNYDVETFFRKWLHDMAANQTPEGGIGQVVPNYLPGGFESAAWGDAATIVPWQIYLTYGDKSVLEDQFTCMKKWVGYITSVTTTQYLWTGTQHFGDWLGLDAPSGSYKGSSREEFIASAFYAYSTSLVIKAGKVIGEDVSEYEKLYQEIVKAFRKEYPEYKTQTEMILAVYFGLAEDLQATADALAELVRKDGVQIRTGFVGTPYILHVLSEYGHTDLAYDLFLRKSYPSWLYSVGKGATTIWEHWDGIMEDGGFWSTDMNSYNHYAYGSVADWVYEKAAGICLLEEYPGFSRVRIAPQTDARLGWLDVMIHTRHGAIHSKWAYVGEKVRYEIRTDVPAEIVIDGQAREVKPGRYTFWGNA